MLLKAAYYGEARGQIDRTYQLLTINRIHNNEMVLRNIAIAGVCDDSCHVTDTENKSPMLTADQSGQVPLSRHLAVMSASSGCNIESEYKSLKHDDPRPDHHRCSNVRSLPYWILLEVRMFCHIDHKLQRNQKNTPPLTLMDVSYLMRPQSESRLSL